MTSSCWPAPLETTGREWAVVRSLLIPSFVPPCDNTADLRRSLQGIAKSGALEERKREVNHNIVVCYQPAASMESWNENTKGSRGNAACPDSNGKARTYYMAEGTTYVAE